MKEIYHTNVTMFDDHITDFYTKQKLIWMDDPGRPSKFFFRPGATDLQLVDNCLVVFNDSLDVFKQRNWPI